MRLYKSATSYWRAQNDDLMREDAALSPPEEVPDLICKNPSRVRGDEAAYALRGCRADFPGFFSPDPKSLERVPHTSDSWRPGQEAGYTVLDDFRARHIGRDNRSPTQHCLDYRQWQTFNPRGHDQNMV